MKAWRFMLSCLARTAVLRVRADESAPVIEVPAARPAEADAPLVLMLTGDGGWAEFVREISRGLAAAGWDVVAIDLRKYLWTRRTPEETARATDAVIRAYQQKWRHSRVVLAGFSRGADLAPFIVNRLPPDTRERVSLVVLLSPGREAEFEFHLVDFLRDPRDRGQLPVMPELRRVTAPLLILYGSDDREALTPPPFSPTVHAFAFAGDHHLGRDYRRIVGLIRAAAHAAAPPGPAH